MEIAVAPDDPPMPSALDLAISYAPHDRRAGLMVLAQFDREMGMILRTTREPLVGQMRLTWWREAVIALDHRAPPAQPVLQGLAAQVMPLGVGGAALGRIIEGWEALLGEPLDLEAVEQFALDRGGGLFAAMARVLGAADEQVELAGQGWAAADLARHMSDQRVADLATGLAEQCLRQALGQRWSRPGRPLGVLAMLARFDLQAGAGRWTAANRFAALMRLRMTGR